MASPHPTFDATLSDKVVADDPRQHPALKPKEEHASPPLLDREGQPKGLASTPQDGFENVLFTLGHQSAQPLILGRHQNTASHQNRGIAG
jgi:hypothetical protein